jgi:hypothetical protein
MKTQLRRLALLVHFGVINPADFYVITAYENTIRFQGTSARSKLLKYNKFNFHVEETGLIEGQRKNLTITLS